MKVAIHQPHYFPWLGYFDKLAKADVFVLLDEVQLEKGSPMVRNRVLDNNGEIKYLTISGETKDFINREYRDLKTKEIELWTTRQINALENYYRKAKYNEEILSVLKSFFLENYNTICEWTCASIQLICKLLNIATPMLYQSKISYDRVNKKSDLVYAICNAIDGDIYLSGRGASMTYLNRGKFMEQGVQIVFQEFQHPSYPQCNSINFIPGVSILDILFNCGIDETRCLFWDNVKRTNEFFENEG